MQIYYTSHKRHKVIESDKFLSEGKPKYVSTKINLCFTHAVQEVIKGNHVDSHATTPGTYANVDCEKCKS